MRLTVALVLLVFLTSSVSADQIFPSVDDIVGGFLNAEVNDHGKTVGYLLEEAVWFFYRLGILMAFAVVVYTIAPAFNYIKDVLVYLTNLGVYVINIFLSIFGSKNRLRILPYVLVGGLTLLYFLNKFLNRIIASITGGG